MSSSRPSQRGMTRQHRDALGADGDRAEPRLPHERDESSDSQTQQGAGAHEVMGQAHDDLMRGLQDTDRRTPMDRAYEQQKGSGVPGTQSAAPDRSGTGQSTEKKRKR